MPKRVLMSIGAHADDIEFNTGGTLLKYHDLGYDIIYVMATNNMSGGWVKLKPDGGRESETCPYDQMMPQRKHEAAEAAARVFGTEPIHLDHPQRHYTDKNGDRVELRYGNAKPDCVAPDTPSILTAHEHSPAIQRVTDLILQHKPEAVLTHGPAMVDMEHIGTCLLVTKAYRNAMDAGHDGLLLHWLDYTPSIFGDCFNRWDTFVDVSDTWERKFDAIELHACQLPDARRVLEFPDCSAACGCRHAETFTIGRRRKSLPPDAAFTFEILNNA